MTTEWKLQHQASAGNRGKTKPPVHRMMGTTTLPTTPHFKLKPPNLPTIMELTSTIKPTSRIPFLSSSCNPIHFHFTNHHAPFRLKSFSLRTVTARVSSDGPGATPPSSKIEETDSGSSSVGDGYVGLFVRMLGLDNDPLDREQAIVALWKYSLGGNKCIDNIMQFQGCINLTVNLLKSDSSSISEAAAGLLRSVSALNVYRDVVVESGAIEEITGLLCQPSLASEVKEQSICTLWNLSADEKLRVKIVNHDIVPLLIKFLGDEDIRVKEAAGGVLSNLALTHSNHDIMVEAGIIPKLAEYLKADIEDDYRVLRKEARNALVELAKNNYYRILIIDEGLIPVPLVGAAAYRSFNPPLHSWPILPDGTRIQRTSTTPSRFGASELLLGLNVEEKNAEIEEAKMKAIIGRSKQQFLARSGSIEVEDAKSSQSEASTNQRFTILPWVDGVARLVLILELDDELAISRAANSIADASINEHMRNSFKEAGAVRHLVRLLNHNNDDIKVAVLGALERLAASNSVCQMIEAEGVMSPLVNILKNSETSEATMEKVLTLLDRILDPNKEMKSKFYSGPVNGFKREVDAVRPDESEGLSEKMTTGDLLDPSIIGRIVEMLKNKSSNLQRKAANVLEFVTIIDPSMKTIISSNIESGLEAVFQQKVVSEIDSDIENQQPEVYAVQIEEAGLAISAASRLLTKLLDLDQFSRTINSTHFTKLLSKILKSNIPLQYKDWVAACLVKLSSMSSPGLVYENPINIEVTLYDTIPRLIEQMKSDSPLDVQEAAVVELNRILSEGVVDATRAVASNGGIFPLVKLVGEGSERAVEAAISILYNLSMDGENHPAIIAAGAVPALRRIVLSERPQWKQALRLLRTLPT
ncbi:ARM repeat superfamily protein [Euphorbia peplus]|nr:ARM repeat superfamily protein [Euphorbia peplus]